VGGVAWFSWPSLVQDLVFKIINFSMRRFDLNDTTFLIPVRIDSPIRHENIKLIIEFLISYFNTNIIVLEAYKKETIASKLSGQIQKFFIKDNNPVFYRSRFINIMAVMATTPFMSIWDTDVLVEPKQIVEAVKLLRKNKADLVYPYDGRFYYTNNEMRRLYIEFKDFSLMRRHLEEMTTHLEYYSGGGAFIVKRDSFYKAGMQNENFTSWGPDDKERIVRFSILNYAIEWINGPMYHLYHPRYMNSTWQEREIFKLQNEYLKIARMYPDELKEYIDTWPHYKKLKENGLINS